jgi:hypothetical protein
MSENLTAGELSNKALRDTTKYDALEVGHAMADSLDAQFDICVENHLNHIDEEGGYPWRALERFCVVMQLAEDPLIKNAKRRKFYCCPFLPSPRPNQAVFLYTKATGKIIKRLWVLPSDVVMAELAGTNIIVHKRYETMQAWSVAFFSGTFWEYIRHEHDIDMVSQEEYISKHKKELVQAGSKLLDSNRSEPFDFSKIHIKKVVDPIAAVA